MAPFCAYTYGDSAHLHAATAIGPSGGTATWTTSYDASGNTACRAATTATTCAGTTPTGALLAYDNEGRLTAWQNLANVTTTPTSTPGLEEALYDGEGQRVQQLDESNSTKTTTQHTYVGGTEDVASQWANTGGAVTTTTTAYYASGLAQSVNGALSYTLADGLGSVSASVSASGTASASQLYGPYGAVRYQAGTLPTDYGFTHQRVDVTSGLDYYNARYYDPIAGQFTSADTTLFGGLNRYGYVGGSPETFIDPSGYAPTCDGTYMAMLCSAGDVVGDGFGAGGGAGGEGGGPDGGTTAPQTATEGDGTAQGDPYVADLLDERSPLGVESVERTYQQEVRDERVGSARTTRVTSVHHTVENEGAANTTRLGGSPDETPLVADNAGSTGARGRASGLAFDPEPQYRADGKPNRGPGAWINVEGPDGSVETVPAGPQARIHAEDNAQAKFPGGRMSRAFGWRGSVANPVWKEIPICEVCQGRYPEELFPPDVDADPNGPWGR